MGRLVHTGVFIVLKDPERLLKLRMVFAQIVPQPRKASPAVIGKRLRKNRRPLADLPEMFCKKMRGAAIGCMRNCT